MLKARTLVRALAGGLLLAGLCLPAGATATADDIGSRARFVVATIGGAARFNPHPKVGPFEILARTAARGCSAEEAAYMSRVILGPREDNGEAMRPYMFALPAIVRYLYQFGDCMNADDKTTLQDLLGRRIDLFAHETLNITIMLASSMYMLAQYFPDQRWHDADGTELTSPEVRARLKDLMARRTAKFFRDGYYEQFSPTYSTVNILPLLNLIEFADDAEVRHGAHDEAVLELGLLRADSFHGWILPPLTRGHASQEIRPPGGGKPPLRATARQVLWFYFGEGSVDTSDLLNPMEPPYLALAAISRWRPPEALRALGSGVTFPYEVETTTPSPPPWDPKMSSVSRWGAPTTLELAGGALVGEHFAVGAGNANILTESYNEANQTFGILTDKDGLVRVIDCYQPYWQSNLGADAWSYDRSSPFQQVGRVGARGMLVYDIPATDPFVFDDKNRFFKERDERAGGLFRFAQCRIPRDADRVIETDKGLYVRRGDVFVALRGLGGHLALDRRPRDGEMAPYWVARLPGARVAIHFDVATVGEVRDFAAFVADVEARDVRWDGVSAHFPAADGRPVEVTFRQVHGPDGRLRSLPAVSVAGVPRQDVPDFVVRTPFLTLRGGVLTLRDPATGATTLKITH